MTRSQSNEGNSTPYRSSMDKRILRFFINNWFMIATIVGVIVGFGVGVALQNYTLHPQTIRLIGLPGNVYIWILELTILPMIVSSIITVLANLNLKENGRVGGMTLGFILISNLLACGFGLVFAHIIGPGRKEKVGGNITESKKNGVILLYIIEVLVRSIFPRNIIDTTVSQPYINFANPSLDNNNLTMYKIESNSQTNMIGVLFCSVAFGMAVNAAKENGHPFKQFFASLGDVVMILMSKFLLLTPIGVMFMVMSAIAKVENLAETFAKIGLFVACHLIAQVAHMIVLLLVIVCLCRNPFKILRLGLPAYFLGFATTSAIISIPKCYEACDSYRMPKSVSRFVLPLAGTMKSDSSGIFIVAAVIFGVQQCGVDLDVGKIVITLILSTAYVCALPNIPFASMVVATTILRSIDVDEKTISVLYALEWFNDRIRSGNIVLSHLLCTTFVYHTCEKNVTLDGDEEEGLNEEGDLVDEEECIMDADPEIGMKLQSSEL